MKKIIKTIFYLFFPLLIGGLVGFLISKNIDYPKLNQPFLAPPKIAFPIAWSILYLLMGIAYFIFKKKNNNNYPIIDRIYYLQLFFNALWSIIFFILKWRFISIIWILILVILIFELVRRIKAYSKVSYYLLLPYLLWTIYATYLNIGIYILN